jgi:hypothetical protein
MTGAGLSEEEAQFYEREFNEGRAIVTVRAGKRDAEAIEILRKHGAYDMQTCAQRGTGGGADRGGQDSGQSTGSWNNSSHV